MIHTKDGQLYKDKYTFDPETLMKAIKCYHDEAESKGNFADLAGLLNYCMLTDEEYAMMKEDPDFKMPLLVARRRRESWLNRKAVDSKAANGCKMLLAQEENGGYSDKPVENREKKFIVKLEGVGLK